jgi:tRNA (guanine10-N2)-methyltransferase
MLCLVHFYDDWVDFRVPELQQLMKMFAIDGSFVKDTSNELEAFGDCFLLVELPDQAAANKICSRSVLIRNIYEVWATANTFVELVDKVKKMIQDKHTLMAPIFNTATNPCSWCIEMLAMYKTLKKEEKERCRESFDFLPINGPVAIKHATLTISMIMSFVKHKKAIAACTYDETSLYPTVSSFCGRLVAHSTMKDEMKKYVLQKRLFLGPTSLDHTLSMLMCNLAGVCARDMVLDPFVGTASILVAASHLKAHCMGTDIDIRVLKGGMYSGGCRDRKAAKEAIKGEDGKGKGKFDDKQTAKTESEPAPAPAQAPERNIFTTFKAYGLPSPEIVRMDLHSIEKHFQLQQNSDEGFFNCIVTDPPYGIRAGGRKSGRGEEVKYEIDAKRRHDHIPATQNYPVEEVMLDLMHASARILVKGGTLIYLIPTPYDFEVTDLPQHPCLQLEQMCLQTLTTRHGRHAVLLRKTKEYTKELEQQFNNYKISVMTGENKNFGQLMHKLERALAPDANEDDEVIKRVSNTCQKRKDSKVKRLERKAKKAATEAEAAATATAAEEETVFTTLP